MVPKVTIDILPLRVERENSNSIDIDIGYFMIRKRTNRMFIWLEETNDRINTVIIREKNKKKKKTYRLKLGILS